MHPARRQGRLTVCCREGIMPPSADCPRESTAHRQHRDTAISIEQVHCTLDTLRKPDMLNKDLDAYSLETVWMFYHAAEEAGYRW
jgi:hypothetical protein